jgi:hypothetical protein
VDLLPVVERLAVAVEAEDLPVARAPVLDLQRAVMVVGDVDEAADLRRLDDEPRALALDVLEAGGAKRLGTILVLLDARRVATLLDAAVQPRNARLSPLPWVDRNRWITAPS